MNTNGSEFLGLCAIGGEVAFHNELKLNGFTLTEKFPGRVFFKRTDNNAKNKPCDTVQNVSGKKPKRRIIRKEKIQALQNTANENLNNSSSLQSEVLSGKEASTVNDAEYANTADTTELFTAMVHANMNLQLADRIALVVAKFPCADFDDLFAGLYNCNWEAFFYQDSKVVIDKVNSRNSKLNSARAIQSVAQKAIYKKLCSKWHLQMLSESGDTFNVRIYLENDIAAVTLDLSGEALHKRNYRKDAVLAPLRETTAAMMLQLMHWKRKTPLHDPFCGSGTIPIEATLYAHNVPPGILRSFTFQNFALFNNAHFKQIFENEKIQGLLRVQTGNLVRITGSDIANSAVALAARNAENACSLIEAELQKIGRNEKLTRPEFVQADIAELSAPYETGLLIGNPPYGERLGDEAEARDIYKKIAQSTKEFPHWQRAFITNLPDLKEILLAYNSRLYIKEQILKSGKLDTVLYEF